MSKREDFFDIIQPEHLYAAAALFGAITFILVLLTYIYLYQKKRRHFTETAISGILDEYVTEAIIEEPEDYQHSNISPELAGYLENPKNRLFIINQLINTRKNLTGGSVENIVKLYGQLGLRKDSIKRFKSRVWHKKARGIYELYMMHQEDMLPDVKAQTNNKNEFVRMEAQTALIVFEGFAGLNFLGDLTRPLNEWQQVKLIEQLQTMNAVEMEHLPMWLASENKYVVFFALRLVELYQQFFLHDTVARLVNSEDVRIARQAILTLGNIASPDTPAILKVRYSSASFEDKREILKVLASIGDDNELPFLEETAKERDDTLKLEVVRSIIKCCIETDSDEVLNNLVVSELVPLTIVKQAQQENKR